ncbi:hypothetical protein B0H21DRAFT_736537 [Amylocystis lapponica]|nr:hypothetical protein B0H21DRAFT_736537 [Amylocystis lapponica]
MSDNSQVYILRVINAKTRTNPIPISLKAPNLYVKIRFPDSGSGQKIQKTHVIKRSYSPVWDQEFTIKGVSNILTELQFDLKHDSYFWKFYDLCFGTVRISINQLITQSKDNPCKLDLQIMNESDLRSKLGWSLEVQLTMHSVHDTETLQQAIARIQRHPHVAHGVSMIQGVESQTSLAKAVKTLLFKLGIVKSLVDEIAKVHPYLNAVWQVVSAMYKVKGIVFIKILVCTQELAFW